MRGHRDFFRNRRKSLMFRSKSHIVAEISSDVIFSTNIVHSPVKSYARFCLVILANALEAHVRFGMKRSCFNRARTCRTVPILHYEAKWMPGPDESVGANTYSLQMRGISLLAFGHRDRGYWQPAPQDCLVPERRDRSRRRLGRHIKSF